MDTQWPRYQVFLQEKSGEPHHDVGSIHAPDRELALLNARDVFVRRPECTSLWIAPVDSIYACTAEELAAEKGKPEDQSNIQSASQVYVVFCKTRSVGSQTFVGKVEATSASQAMRLAVERFHGPPQPFVWWVVPLEQITMTEPQDAGSLFEPALDKPFRLSTDFRTVTAMRQIKKGGVD